MLGLDPACSCSFVVDWDKLGEPGFTPAGEDVDRRRGKGVPRGRTLLKAPKNEDGAFESITVDLSFPFSCGASATRYVATATQPLLL